MRYLRLPVRVWNGDCLSCKLLSTAWCWRVARTCWRPTRCQSSEFQSNWSADWLILDFHSNVSTRVTRDLVVSRCPQTEWCVELCVEHSVVPADLKCYKLLPTKVGNGCRNAKWLSVRQVASRNNNKQSVSKLLAPDLVLDIGRNLVWRWSEFRFALPIWII